MFPFPTVPVAGLVRSTLDEAVTLLGPPATTAGEFGETIEGARPTVTTSAASVRAETPRERLAYDRTSSAQSYRVRVEASATMAAADGTYALRWDRPAHEGGAVTLGLSGPGVATPSGQFLDFTGVSA